MEKTIKGLATNDTIRLICGMGGAPLEEFVVVQNNQGELAIDLGIDHWGNEDICTINKMLIDGDLVLLEVRKQNENIFKPAVIEEV